MIAPQPQVKREFNLPLNGYRGFCALLVFAFHLGSAGVVPIPSGTPFKDQAALFWASLAFGVEMFFMISGFVILGSLLRHATLKGFLQDRFIRIFSAWVPALIAVTAVCVVLKMKMFTDVTLLQGAGIFIGNLLLLPPLVPLPLVHQGSWSLSYEWVFYIAAVAGAWVLRRAAPRPWAVGAWVMISGLFVCMYPRALFFLTGVTVFALQPWFARHQQWLKFPLASLVMFLVAWRLTGIGTPHTSATLFQWLLDGHWVAALVAFLASLHMFASVALNASRQVAFLSTRTFQFLGTISYSFYLWHALVMSATKRAAAAYVVPQYGIAAGFMFFFVSSLVIGILVAWLSWSVFEVKLAKLLHKAIVARANRRRAAEPAAQAFEPDTAPAQPRYLWIARYIPYPLDAGAKVYSAKLAQAVAESGIAVRFLGFGDTHAVPGAAASVEWISVPGQKRAKAMAVLSTLPIAAAIDGTVGYRELLEAQLRERWDAIVLDGYGAGWALDQCLRHRAPAGSQHPVLVHVSHNHEEVLWHAMSEQSKASALKRFALRLNAAKVRILEQRLVRSVDLLTTITEEDQKSLGAGIEAARTLCLTPGYSGWIASERRITVLTPRRVIIMGSFQWVVKQENLARFVEAADPIFKAHGIELDVIGEVPSALLARLRERTQATHFHGFVKEVAPYFARARIGIVPECIGGGFKLKFLDYIFGRVPVATLTQAAAGLPPELRTVMLSSDSLEGMIQEIVANIDRIDELNAMQDGAFARGRELFKWGARGHRLKQAIANLQRRIGIVTRPAADIARAPQMQENL